mgnify:CR=1 FL=1
MSTPSTPSTPSSSLGESNAPSAILIVPQESRADFDAAVRDIAGVITPLPAISDAVVATDDSGNVVGTTYVAIRHVVSPLILTEESPADTLTRLCDAIADQLRATVRESILATHGDGQLEGEVATSRELSYDVYVPEGQEPPAGCERLPVTVWRRRVC